MTLDRYLLKEFTARCQIAFDLCILHKGLFDNNKENGYMKQEPFYSIFRRINHTTLEHFLLQIAKLHDPASQKQGKRNKSNLSINYIIEEHDWSQTTYNNLIRYRDEMNKLYECIKPARHWALCHNDVASIINKETLGSFERNADKEYFVYLEKFLVAAHKDFCAEDFTFDRYPEQDILKFIRHFNGG